MAWEKVKKRSSFIYLFNLCAHLLVFIVLAMEKRRMGTCQVRLSHEQCKSGPWPDSSLKWYGTGTWSIYPTGCFVQHKQVFFNTMKNNIKCDRRPADTYCLCNKQGKSLTGILEGHGHQPLLGFSLPFHRRYKSFF